MNVRPTSAERLTVVVGLSCASRYRDLHVQQPMPTSLSGAYDVALLVADAVEVALIRMIEEREHARTFERYHIAMRRALG